MLSPTALYNTARHAGCRWPVPPIPSCPPPLLFAYPLCTPTPDPLDALLLSIEIWENMSRKAARHDCGEIQDLGAPPPHPPLNRNYSTLKHQQNTPRQVGQKSTAADEHLLIPCEFANRVGTTREYDHKGYMADDTRLSTVGPAQLCKPVVAAIPLGERHCTAGS